MAGDCGCQGQCACAILSTAGISVIGDGSASNPFKLGVIYSMIPHNQSGPDIDGKLYTPPTTILDGEGNPIEPDGDGHIQLPPPCILGYDSEPIPADPETGCVQLPPAAAPAFGCGLAAEEDGTLVVNTSGTWPLARLDGTPFGGDDTDGGGIYCDSNGQLRGLPDHTAAGLNDNAHVVFSGSMVLASTDDGATAPTGLEMLINNSTERMMTGLEIVSGTFIASSILAGELHCHVEFSPDASSWTQMGAEVIFPYDGDGGQVNGKMLVVAHRDVAVFPGTATAWYYRLKFHNDGVGGCTVTYATIAYTGLAVTL